MLKNILIIEAASINHVSNQESKASSRSNCVLYSIWSNYVIILKKNIMEAHFKGKNAGSLSCDIFYPLNCNFLLRKLMLCDPRLMIYINLYSF